jgi:hypothetical protein
METGDEEVNPARSCIMTQKTMKLQLPPGAFCAYLFDCDGTIVDSMPLHYIAWTRALGVWGATFDEDLFYQWGGKPPREIIADLNEMQGLQMPVPDPWITIACKLKRPPGGRAESWMRGYTLSFWHHFSCTFQVRGAVTMWV